MSHTNIKPANNDSLQAQITIFAVGATLTRLQVAWRRERFWHRVLLSLRLFSCRTANGLARLGAPPSLHAGTDCVEHFMSVPTANVITTSGGRSCNACKRRFYVRFICRCTAVAIAGRGQKLCSSRCCQRPLTLPAVADAARVFFRSRRCDLICGIFRLNPVQTGRVSSADCRWLPLITLAKILSAGIQKLNGWTKFGPRVVNDWLASQTMREYEAYSNNHEPKSA